MFIVVGPNSSFPFIKKRHTFAQLLNLSPERGARWVESERTPADGPPCNLLHSRSRHVWRRRCPASRDAEPITDDSRRGRSRDRHQAATS